VVIESELARAGGGIDLRITDGLGRTVMAAADVVLLASGTATLEALLLKRPMVVTYRLHPLTWAVARRLVRVTRVAIPNLLAGRDLVPELLQDEAEPERLGAAVLRYLAQPALGAELRAEFERIHRELRRDADARAAEAVLELVEARPPASGAPRSRAPRRRQGERTEGPFPHHL
jgi:lipid-A-disaccharide synthase